MPFKIGSFNLIPSFVTVITAVAGIGALPYGVKYLMNGEAPTLKDRFEDYLEWKAHTWDKDAPYGVTHQFQFDRSALEQEWRKWHVAAGNVEGATLPEDDPIRAKMQ